LRGATLASWGDHRIHMALAVAGLAADGPTTIDGKASAAVSYPGFHADLARLEAP
jgi:3-phosphoshikimate 1-carboxyvinyltransferase